jgi:hypothetical protein
MILGNSGRHCKKPRARDMETPSVSDRLHSAASEQRRLKLGYMHLVRMAVTGGWVSQVRLAEETSFLRCRFSAGMTVARLWEVR